jgi:hypothetical protein
MFFSVLMETTDKAYIKLKWGLALKKIIDENKAINQKKKEEGGEKDKNLIDSFGKLESSSGIPKATLVNICMGRKNGASTTWIAIINAFGLNLTQFSAYYDGLSVDDVMKYKSEVDTAISDRMKKKK